MDLNQFQREFFDFLGEERFRKFLAALTDTPPELRWWQEREWERFIDRYPIYSVWNQSEIRSHLDLCEIHFLRFEKDRVPIYYTSREPDPEYTDGWRTLFTHANTVRERRPPPMNSKTHETVKFCPGCRLAYREWKIRLGMMPGKG